MIAISLLVITLGSLAIIGLCVTALLKISIRTKQRGTKTAPPNRLILPMSSGVQILSGTSMQVTGQPQNFAFRIDGLIIENANDWVINSITIDEQPQFLQPGDVPGDMFSAEAQGCGIRLDVAPVGSNVRIVATYIGEGKQAFCCMALGTPIRAGQEVEPNKLILPMSSGVNVSTKSVQITARPQGHIFRPERLVIHHGRDWIVSDAKVGNRSQLMQSGDVPGAAFAAGSGVTFCMDDVAPGGDFVLVATYIGADADGAPFLASVIGEAEKSSHRTASAHQNVKIGRGNVLDKLRIVA